MEDLVAEPPKLILCPVKDNVPALVIVTAGVFAGAKIRIGQPVTAVNGCEFFKFSTPVPVFVIVTRPAVVPAPCTRSEALLEDAAIAKSTFNVP